MGIKLKPGDIFLTAVPGIIGRGINAIQRIHDKSSHSSYSHAGLVIDPDGTTIESQGRVVNWNIYEKYDGVKVLIARNVAMNAQTFKIGYSAVKHHLGQTYPIYRILYHLFPPIAKLSDERVVCSELVAKFLHRVELFGYINGCSPDDIHNHLCWAYGWDIIFNGRIS